MADSSQRRSIPQPSSKTGRLMRSPRPTSTKSVFEEVLHIWLVRCGPWQCSNEWPMDVIEFLQRSTCQALRYYIARNMQLHLGDIRLLLPSLWMSSAAHSSKNLYREAPIAWAEKKRERLCDFLLQACADLFNHQQSSASLEPLTSNTWDTLPYLNGNQP